MLNHIWQSGGYMSFITLLFYIVSYAALVFVMLPLRELAHAVVATRLGDDTPRWHGRLTLNPLRHLDTWGTVMLVLFGIGYAKPVPVNPRNFANPKRDMALTALAGPVSNLLMALVSLLLFRIARFTVTDGTVLSILGVILVRVFAQVNLCLAVFNLLPIPPLDGFRIFGAILPPRFVEFVDRYHNYVRWVVLLLVFTGALDYPLTIMIRFLGGLLCAIVGLPNQF